MSFLPTATSAPVAPATGRTTRPITVGTSILGVVYDGGVMLAADTLISYGSLARNQRIPRLHAVSQADCLLGASGEFSDFQALVELIERKTLEDSTTSIMDSLYEAEEKSMSAESLWNYLRMVLYEKRNKMNPYWNTVVVAGTRTGKGSDAGKPFLGWIDKLGTTIETPYCATGLGSYIAMPLMHEAWKPDLTEGEARALLEDCLRVLFYRDARSSATVQLAKCEITPGSKPTCVVSEPYTLEHDTWNNSHFQRRVAHLDGDGGW